MNAASHAPQKAQVYTQHKQTAQAKIAELAKEMQEPARQTDCKPVSEQSATGTDHTSEQQGDAAAPFIWKMGKWKDTHIADLPIDYLAWAVQNISRQDHQIAAADEIDRRQKQDVMAFEGQ